MSGKSDYGFIPASADIPTLALPENLPPPLFLPPNISYAPSPQSAPPPPKPVPTRGGPPPPMAPPPPPPPSMGQPPLNPFSFGSSSQQNQPVDLFSLDS